MSKRLRQVYSLPSRPVPNLGVVDFAYRPALAKESVLVHAPCVSPVLHALKFGYYPLAYCSKCRTPAGRGTQRFLDATAEEASYVPAPPGWSHLLGTPRSPGGELCLIAFHAVDTSWGGKYTLVAFRSARRQFDPEKGRWVCGCADADCSQ